MAMRTRLLNHSRQDVDGAVVVVAMMMIIMMMEVLVVVLVPKRLVTELVPMGLVVVVVVLMVHRQKRHGYCWKGWHSGSTSGTGTAWCG
jgi:uncharacterized membrane-anchored protein